MSFKVKTDALLSSGPYKLVRNPIYLADLVAFTGFALCLPPIGLLLPVLLFLHYTQLIGYEEISLRKEFGRDYAIYRKSRSPPAPGLRRLQAPRGRPPGDHGHARRDPAQRPLSSFYPRLRPGGGHGQARLGRGGRSAGRRGLGDRSHEDRRRQGRDETGCQDKDVQGRPLRQLLGRSAARPGGLGDRYRTTSFFRSPRAAATSWPSFSTIPARSSPSTSTLIRAICSSSRWPPSGCCPTGAISSFSASGPARRASPAIAEGFGRVCRAMRPGSGTATRGRSRGGSSTPGAMSGICAFSGRPSSRGSERGDSSKGCSRPTARPRERSFTARSGRASGGSS